MFVYVQLHNKLYSHECLTPRNHSCYDVDFKGEHASFCYPLITVGGISKCGTSSIYNILAGHTKFFGPRSKEECNHLFLRLKNDLLVFIIVL